MNGIGGVGPLSDAPGLVLQNINEGYTGDAPDIMPYQQGEPMHHYGAREPPAGP